MVTRFALKTRCQEDDIVFEFLSHDDVVLPVSRSCARRCVQGERTWADGTLTSFVRWSPGEPTNRINECMPNGEDKTGIISGKGHDNRGRWFTGAERVTAAGFNEAPIGLEKLRGGPSVWGSCAPNRLKFVCSKQASPGAHKRMIPCFNMRRHRCC